MIAGIVALSAFAVACIAGLGAGLGGTAILTRALISMACGYALGSAIAWVAGRAVRDHAAGLHEQRPIPEVRLPSESDAPQAEDAQDPRSPHDPTPEMVEEAQPRAAA